MPVQFMAALLQEADVEVVEVVINRLAWGTFYATVVISGSTGTRHVEGRPSDAIALGLAVGAPIRGDVDVMAAGKERAEIVNADAYPDGIDEIVREIVAGAPLPAPPEQPHPHCTCDHWDSGRLPWDIGEHSAYRSGPFLRGARVVGGSEGHLDGARAAALPRFARSAGSLKPKPPS